MATTGRLRFTGIVSNTGVTDTSNVLEGGTGVATAALGTLMTLKGAGENAGIPVVGATITGVRFRAQYRNLGGGTGITTFCRLSFGGVTKNMDLSATGDHTIDEGGENDMLGFTISSQGQLDLAEGFRLFTGHAGGSNDSLGIQGVDTNDSELPSIEIFYTTAGEDFTRETLKTFTTSSSNFTAQAHTFTLENNVSTTAGFSMQGKGGKKLMESSSITSLTNCSLVSSSNNVAFLIDSGSTATFTFTPTATILKEDVLMLAPNVEVVNFENPATSSFFGVDLSIT